mmetsp:Transcript_21609/g.74777  ORF Transcript_21609/g.74777 Transcript_21609/m.74777 type:complete len:248 (+) Transcript_21609:1384-2127(+)
MSRTPSSASTSNCCIQTGWSVLALKFEETRLPEPRSASDAIGSEDPPPQSALSMTGRPRPRIKKTLRQLGARSACASASSIFAGSGRSRLGSKLHRSASSTLPSASGFPAPFWPTFCPFGCSACHWRCTAPPARAATSRWNSPIKSLSVTSSWSQTATLTTPSSAPSSKASAQSGVSVFFFVVEETLAPRTSNVTKGSDDPPAESRFRSLIARPRARSRKILRALGALALSSTAAKLGGSGKSFLAS